MMEFVANADIQSPPKRVTSAQLELLSRLADAGTPKEVAAVIVRLAREQAECDSAIVVWDLDGEGGPASEPAIPMAAADLKLARTASMSPVPVFSSDGRRVAIRLFETNPAILLLATRMPSDAPDLVKVMQEQLRIAGRHLWRALESAALEVSHLRLERSEKLQGALFAISDLAGSDRDMSDVLRSIHAIVGTLMYAENFFIVLYNDERDTLRFLYFADVEDTRPRDPNLEIPMQTRENSLTWYLIRGGKPLMGDTEQLRAQMWPHLEWSYSNGTPTLLFGVENSGVGPALVEGVRVTVDVFRFTLRIYSRMSPPEVTSRAAPTP